MKASYPEPLEASYYWEKKNVVVLCKMQLFWDPTAVSFSKQVFCDKYGVYVLNLQAVSEDQSWKFATFEKPAKNKISLICLVFTLWCSYLRAMKSLIVQKLVFGIFIKRAKLGLHGQFCVFGEAM